MHQIYWMIGLIPDSVLIWIYGILFTAGITLYLGSKLFRMFPFKYLPFVGQYPLLSEIGGVVLMVFGALLYGGYANEMEWRTKVAEAQAKVAKAEEASKDANKKLEEERKKKAKVRTEYITTVKERIVKETQVIDAECKVAPEAISILNDAAKNPFKKGSVTIEEVKK